MLSEPSLRGTKTRSLTYYYNPVDKLKGTIFNPKNWIFVNFLYLIYCNIIFCKISSIRISSPKTRIKTKSMSSQENNHITIRISSPKTRIKTVLHLLINEAISCLSAYLPQKQGLRRRNSIGNTHDSDLSAYLPQKQGLRLSIEFIKKPFLITIRISSPKTRIKTSYFQTLRRISYLSAYLPQKQGLRPIVSLSSMFIEFYPHIFPKNKD